MDREMNTKCVGGERVVGSVRGVGGARLMSGGAGRRVMVVRGQERICQVQQQQKRTSSSNSFLGVRWRGASWPALMHLGVVLLILVNSVALSSCSSSVSINSEGSSSSISKNTVLGGHEEASAEHLSVIPIVLPSAAPTVDPTTTTTTTTETGSSDTTSGRDKSGRIDSSAEVRRKEKKGSISNNSSYDNNNNKSSSSNKEKSKASVRINVSNNTTSPFLVDPAKNKQPKTGAGVAAKEYWNKQQKVAAALKAGKKGK